MDYGADQPYRHMVSCMAYVLRSVTSYDEVPSWVQLSEN